MKETVSESILCAGESGRTGELKCKSEGFRTSERNQEGETGSGSDCNKDLNIWRQCHRQTVRTNSPLLVWKTSVKARIKLTAQLAMGGGQYQASR